jgi:hypothetical protein
MDNPALVAKLFMGRQRAKTPVLGAGARGGMPAKLPLRLPVAGVR